MKAKVLKKFKDIHTGEIYKANDVINVTKKRFEEINKNGVKKKKGVLVEEVEEETQGENTEADADAEAKQEENPEAETGTEADE